MHRGCCWRIRRQAALKCTELPDLTQTRCDDDCDDDWDEDWDEEDLDNDDRDDHIDHVCRDD